jgi:hypothetical protein
MIDRFYAEGEQPTPDQRKRMWHAVRRDASGKRSRLMFIPDARSFAYGIAASVLMYFSAVGVVSTVRNSIAGAAPEAVRLDEAYQSAIEQFERVVPRLVASTDAKARPAIAEREAELSRMNAAIAELRLATGEGDLSPLKQRRLRQLYSLKLQVLQAMIENGEVEL